MNADILRAVLVTTLLCVAAGLVMFHRQERRHEREQHQAAEYWRAREWRQATGRDALTDEYVDLAFKAIAARWDTGLDILGSEGDGK